MDEGIADAPGPRDFDGLRTAIVERQARLPRRLAQVAAFAMSAPDEIAFGTAASVAVRAGVQPSTLVRFGRSFGYEGFSDLQNVFRERLRDRVPSYDERLRALHVDEGEARQAELLFDGFTEASLRSIRSSRARIGPGQLEEAAGLLARAGTIYLVAQRRSFPVTSYMSYLLGKLGVKNVLVGSAAGTEMETVSFATTADAALVVSYTPYAQTTLALARQLQALHVPRVVVTDSPFSPVVPAHGSWFEIVETDFEGFRPLAATMVLMMTLATTIGELRAGAG